MTTVTFKNGVLPIAHLAPAGVRILGALERVARRLGHHLTITAADREHGATDAHTLGEAYDVRTKDLPDEAAKLALLRELMLELADDATWDAPRDVSTGLATRRFYAQLEDLGLPNEHLHVQRRAGSQYPNQPRLDPGVV